MTAIPIFRTAHLLPYLTFLGEQGVAISKELRRVKLPSDIPDQPDAYLPKLSVLAFINNISQQEGIDECGLRAARYHKADALTQQLFRQLASSPTLKSALELFIRFAAIEDVSLTFWLKYEPGSVKICDHDCPGDVSPIKQRNAEWTQLMVILSVIRLFAGHNWFPKRMGLGVNVSLNNYAYAQFPNTELHINQHYSWIEIPYSLLALPATSKPATKTDTLCESSFEINLPSTLQQLIKSYLHDDSLSINTLAEISGMSLRSLQRRLSESGTSYSELLEQVRIQKSMELLGSSDAKIIDVAYAMGYRDPSHFSRAFRRLTGNSPRLYRQQYGVKMS